MLDFVNYRRHVDEMIAAALAAADPFTAVTRHLQRSDQTLITGNRSYDLAAGRLFVISVGKAAVPMSRAAARILGNAVTEGIVIKKKTGDSDTPQSAVPANFTLFEAGHPVSDADSLRATQVVTEILHATQPDDLVLCLISGGTSALLTQPLVDLEDWQALTEALLASGCTINELNTVRRRLDRVKGGGLAHLAAPATTVSLILSDVVGNPLEAIGSGPTVPTEDPPGAAEAVLARYGVAERLDARAWQRIQQTLDEELQEQPPTHYGDHVIVGDVRSAATAALAAAVRLGFVSQLLTARLEGEAREVARVAAALATDALPGRCLILGGETTVTLGPESGRGGRNQELALSAALALEGWPRTVIASFATDGEDGPTDAGGAVVTGETAVYARTHNLNPRAYLDRNDSYSFFAALDALQTDPDAEVTPPPKSHLRPGPTGTNVNDLLIILTYPAASDSSG